MIQGGERRLVMKPLVAIVGRPNVGKSTFFNRMLGERVAIVEELPGTTRDRLYGDTDWNGREFTLIDTGGLEFGSGIPVGQVGLNGQPGDIMKNVRSQAELAIEEADVIVFMVDARSGITAADEEVADLLRRTQKPVILAANKADNAARRQDAVEFYSLGLGSLSLSPPFKVPVRATCSTSLLRLCHLKTRKPKRRKMRTLCAWLL